MLVYEKVGEFRTENNFEFVLYFQENQVENDDEELLQRARNMDEYKDDHKRGWGNRHNRS